MITTSTAIRANLRICASCRHFYEPVHPLRPLTDLPLTPYKCILSGHKVNPNQCPCSLYEPIPPPVYPPPPHPHPHHRTP